jgi:hypothetical protein
VAAVAHHHLGTASLPALAPGVGNGSLHRHHHGGHEVAAASAGGVPAPPAHVNILSMQSWSLEKLGEYCAISWPSQSFSTYPL